MILVSNDVLTFRGGVSESKLYPTHSQVLQRGSQWTTWVGRLELRGIGAVHFQRIREGRIASFEHCLSMFKYREWWLVQRFNRKSIETSRSQTGPFTPAILGTITSFTVTTT